MLLQLIHYKKNLIIQFFLYLLDLCLDVDSVGGQYGICGAYKHAEVATNAFLACYAWCATVLVERYSLVHAVMARYIAASASCALAIVNAWQELWGMVHHVNNIPHNSL